MAEQVGGQGPPCGKAVSLDLPEVWYAGGRRMNSIIAIANQKGGVGKTTSAAALAVSLSRMGQRVLLVDVDPQANLTSSFGFRDEEGELYQALKAETALPVVQIDEHLWLTPSSAQLARGEAEFLAEPAGSQFLLQTSLSKTTLPDKTVIILDCPPSLGVLAVNCLVAAQFLLVTVMPGKYELDGLKRLQATVDRLTERINPDLEVAGVVLTNCDSRKKITGLVQERLSNVYEILGTVHGDAQLQYACGDGTLLYLQSARSRALREYGQVAEKLASKVWKKEAVRT